MESGRYPELAARFYENDPMRGEESLAAYLARRTKDGHLRDEGPLTMARHLISLSTGSPVRWFVLGFDPKPITKRSLKKHIEAVVNLFLRAYGLTGVHQSGGVERYFRKSRITGKRR